MAINLEFSMENIFAEKYFPYCCFDKNAWSSFDRIKKLNLFGFSRHIVGSQRKSTLIRQK